MKLKQKINIITGQDLEVLLSLKTLYTVTCFLMWLSILWLPSKEGNSWNSLFLAALAKFEFLIEGEGVASSNSSMSTFNPV